MARVSLDAMARERREVIKNKNRNKPLIVIEDEDGKQDVIFNLKSERMSDWRGEHTSTMAKDHDGRRILKWMLSKDFDEEAMEIVSRQVDEYGNY